MAEQQLSAAEVTAMLTESGVDLSQLTITDDPAVWQDIETGKRGTSVRIDGPNDARRESWTVLMYEHGLSNAPYPDHDFWSR